MHDAPESARQRTFPALLAVLRRARQPNPRRAIGCEYIIDHRDGLQCGFKLDSHDRLCNRHGLMTQAVGGCLLCNKVGPEFVGDPHRTICEDRHHFGLPLYD